MHTFRDLGITQILVFHFSKPVERVWLPEFETSFFLSFCLYDISLDVWDKSKLKFLIFLNEFQYHRLYVYKLNRHLYSKIS